MAQPQLTSAITVSDINKLDYEEFVPSKDVEELTVGWQAFKEIEQQIGFLKTADLTFFKGDLTLIKSTFEEARNAIPDRLNTNPIKSRLTVIETKFLKASK